MHILKHLAIFQVFSNRRLDEIYASIAIRSFAVGMISIFIPIFLYVQGFPLQRIFLFYVVYHATHGIFTYWCARFAARWGFKHAIFVSAPLLILFYSLLYLIESNPGIWWLAAISGGLMSAFFWMGYHLDFASVGDRASYGKEIGTLKILIAIFHTVGPVVGGLVLTFAGFNTLFLVVSIIILASSIPLFFSRDIHRPIDFRFRDVFQSIPKRDAVAFSAHGMVNGIELVVWPVFIFTTIFQEYSTIGLVSTVSFAATLGITYFVGKKTDQNKRKTLRLGSLSVAAMWIVRVFIKTPLQLFMGDFVYGGATTFIQVPFDALSYENANKANMIRYIIFREFMINTARIIAFAVLMLVSSYTTIFLATALVALLYLFY